jgi:hypothetical protein
VRKWGEIDGVTFRRQGWCIYNLAIEYKLNWYNGSATVYVNNFKELKEEIQKAITADNSKGYDHG